VAEQTLSFTRGIFAGVVLDSLLFPYPRRLDERNADEARTVRRLIKSLREMESDLIDSAKFDEEETIPENVIRAFAEAGMLPRFVDSRTQAVAEGRVGAFWVF